MVGINSIVSDSIFRLKSSWVAVFVFSLFGILFLQLHGILLLLKFSILFIGILGQLYAGFQLTRHVFYSICLVLLGLIILPISPFWFYVASIGSIFILIWTRYKKTYLAIPWQPISSWSWGAIGLWLIIGVFGMYQSNQGYWLYDAFHPLYELSIGNSYDSALLNAPDLSYSGKEVKYHFLSIRIPIALAKLLDIPVLYAVYLFVPLVYTSLFLILINSVSAKYSIFSISYWMLLFFPLILESGPLWLSLSSRTLTMTGSYFLATILLLLTVYFFLEKKYLFYIILSSLVLLTKAPFYIVLISAVSLYYLRLKEWKMGVSIVSIKLFVLVIFFLLFFKGAHAQNLWMVFPLQPGFYWLMGGTIWYLIISITVLTLMVFYISVFHWRKKATNETLFLSSLVFGGAILGVFSLEITELNSIQFLIAVVPYSVVLLVHYWRSISGNIKKYFFVLGVLLITLNSVQLLVKHSVIRNVLIANISHIQVLYSKWMKKAYAPEPMLRADEYDSWSFASSLPKIGYTLFPSMNDFASFKRSALSGQYFYLEGMKYKGLCMEPDYALRLYSVLKFYKLNSTNLSKHTIYSIDRYWTTKTSTESSSNKETNSTKDKWVQILSGGKTWSFYNIQPKIESEISFLVNSQDYFIADSTWTKTFLIQNKIQYVVFENGDQPNSFFQSISSLISRKGNVEIYKVNLLPVR